jgi:hypothetical protein
VCPGTLSLFFVSGADGKLRKRIINRIIKLLLIAERYFLSVNAQFCMGIMKQYDSEASHTTKGAFCSLVAAVAAKNAPNFA